MGNTPEQSSRAHRNISVIACVVCRTSPGAWQQEGALCNEQGLSSEQHLGSKIVILLEAEESFSVCWILYGFLHWDQTSHVLA